MSDGIAPPKPPTGKPFDEFYANVGELTDVSMSGLLFAEKENPGWYRVQLDLFDGPKPPRKGQSTKSTESPKDSGKKSPMELPWGMKLEKITVEYYPDSKEKITRDPVQLCHDPEFYYRAFFIDQFEGVNWEKELRVGLVFEKGTIHYNIDQKGETVQSLEKWHVHILDKPEDVPGGVYEIEGRDTPPRT